MGKSSSPTELEFTKLQILLIHSANDMIKCLKMLKYNLGKYDRRHGLHFRSTSKYFMKNDIQVVKDTITDLRYVAKRIRRSKTPTRSEISAARMSMNNAADAMNDLKQAGRMFDQNHGKSSGVTAIIDNILSGDDDNQKDNNGDVVGSDDKNKENKPKRGWFGKRKTSGGGPDRVEVLVRLTLHDSFSGFSALKQQISATENAVLE
ncbi:Hypothetical protein PHPALM_7008 [Phytophthora palmivora]|uniref:Uncharacterized protein n=1 Tax=Phytophthora palmivora TaxID=4796 RepID=A0A2P4YDF3_9STRA|nr:Hypothetical protein PHPALM_7008 [Phytophthora palmivora]